MTSTSILRPPNLSGNVVVFMVVLHEYNEMLKGMIMAIPMIRANFFNPVFIF